LVNILSNMAEPLVEALTTWRKGKDFSVASGRRLKSPSKMIRRV